MFCENIPSANNEKKSIKLPNISHASYVWPRQQKIGLSDMQIITCPISIEQKPRYIK